MEKGLLVIVMLISPFFPSSSTFLGGSLASASFYQVALCALIFDTEKCG
jgi:hypothetical protein